MNTFEYAVLFQKALDAKLVASSVTGWMTENSTGVIYNGGNTYKVPKIDMDDIEDYNRSTGFAPGSVTVAFEEKTFEKDWGKTFSLDSMDINETNFVPVASEIMGEFQRTKVAPKLDAYRLTKIAKLAAGVGHSRTLAPTKSNVYSELKNDIINAQTDTGVIETDLVIHISRTAYNLLCDSTELQKTLQVNGGAADLNSNVKTVNGAVLKVTDDKLMKTEDGKLIYWEVMVKTAPVAIVKNDKVRIFTPDVNQAADAYKLDQRLYHTLNINDNQLDAVYVAVAE